MCNHICNRNHICTPTSVTTSLATSVTTSVNTLLLQDRSALSFIGVGRQAAVEVIPSAASVNSIKPNQDLTVVTQTSGGSVGRNNMRKSLSSVICDNTEYAEIAGLLSYGFP